MTKVDLIKSEVNMTEIQYPALIYKIKSNKIFVANCIIKKLVGYGKTEKAAILNLESVLNSLNNEYPVTVKPVYKFLPDLANA